MELFWNKTLLILVLADEKVDIKSNHSEKYLLFAL